MAMINIGLDKNIGGKLTVAEALTACAAFGLALGSYTVAQSATELTLVAELIEPASPVALDRLSVALYQDCVAYVDGDKGALYGPKADLWGPFNPAYFIPLADVAERAAA